MKILKWVLVGIGVLIVGGGIAAYILLKPTLDIIALTKTAADPNATLTQQSLTTQGHIYNLLFYSDAKVIKPGGNITSLSRPGKTTASYSITFLADTTGVITATCDQKASLEAVFNVTNNGVAVPVCQIKDSGTYSYYFMDFKDAAGRWHRAILLNAALGEMSNPATHADLVRILGSITVQ